MLAVGINVEQIVEDIRRRGAQTETEECQRAGKQRIDVEQAVRSHQGDENQAVLGPLMYANRLEPDAQARFARFEILVRLAECRNPAHDLPRCVDSDGCAGRFPDRNIDGTVGHIFKAILAEASYQRGCLGSASQIRLVVGCHHFIEDAKMILYLLCEILVAAGNENDLATAAFGFFDDANDFFVVGQG